MKRVMQMAAFVLVLVLGSSLRNDVSAQYRGDVSYQTFYDELSPHGQWVDYPSHGYVWVPNAGADFRPYATKGHWVWTDDYEWMWVSDYEWGWAPFHYGRWLEDDYYGWVWVPGYEWSPAWVAWRDGGDYYGWAPLRPGINISVNFNLGSYAPPHSYWCFVPRRHIASVGWYSHRVDYRRNVTIINQTTIINNYNYNRNVFRTGPRRSSVEVYTGRINPVRLRESNNPGRSVFRNNEVSVFRPQVRPDNNRQFAPRTFQRYDERTANNNNARSNNVSRSNENGNNPVFRRNRNENAGAGNATNNLPRREVNNRENPARQPNNGNNNAERRRQNPARNNEVRQQDNNNNNTERRVFRADKEKRETTPTENRRVFERKTANDNPARQPQVRNQRAEKQPQVRQQSPQRQPQVRNQRVEKQPQVRQQSPQRQPQQRVERQKQQQPRQFERKNDNAGGRGNKRF